MKFDYSTIDMARLRTRPVWNRPPTYHLQKDPGNGCFLDPPGYPSYFTQSVYTQHGNHPGRGATMVIRDDAGVPRVVQTAHEPYEKLQPRLKRLYVPLPFEHPRVQAWVAHLFVHLNRCYRDDERLEYSKPGVLIYPLPDYKLKTFKDDPRWSDEYRRALRQEVDTFNADERRRADRIAVPDNHLAVRAIREWYPDYVPPSPLPTGGEYGDWYERLAERPTPETCEPPSWLHGHRTDGRCQFCGYTATPVLV